MRGLELWSGGGSSKIHTHPPQARPYPASSTAHVELMANSRFEYVKEYEEDTTLLRDVGAIIRIDGRAFHTFATVHKFVKPFDGRAAAAMIQATQETIKQFDNVLTCGYTHSDEVSIYMSSGSKLFGRRLQKLLSTIVSAFTAHYVLAFLRHFGVTALDGVAPPTFDGRIVLYPTKTSLHDYFCWRAADCHINALYNTAFWALVQQGGVSERTASRTLDGTVSAEKHELLFSRFGINYAKLPEIERRGSFITQNEVSHRDILKDPFWHAVLT